MQRTFVCLGLVLTVGALLAQPVNSDSAAQKIALGGKEAWAPWVQRINTIIDKECPGLEELYRQLHANPELAFEEVKTAARMAKELKFLGFEVTKGVGGTGVVGVLKNGKGPTILVRTDMDALPVTETTGLPYASKQRQRDKEGKEVGLMHACGHDMHMTCAIGVGRVLTALKDKWQGTVIIICQPAEEVGGGARRMIADGLFKRFPRPDFCLGLHCDGRRAHGHLSYSEGLMMANVDTIDITVRGKGGHGSAPHTTIDPIVLAARIIVDLQTIVSREVSPTDAAVVTVRLDPRRYQTQHHSLGSEIAADRAKAQGRRTQKSVGSDCADYESSSRRVRAPEPIIRIEVDDFTPAVYNNATLAKRTTALFREIFGKDRVHEQEPVMGGEDFGRYGREGIPIFFYFLGTVAPEKVAASVKSGEPLPSLHSEKYFPVPEPSIRTGVLSMSVAVLNLLDRKEP